METRRGDRLSGKGRRGARKANDSADAALKGCGRCSQRQLRMNGRMHEGETDEWTDARGRDG
eukprot:204928-Pleurochrysis_carterae.AAC.2